jgi:hypothetical protein
VAESKISEKIRELKILIKSRFLKLIPFNICGNIRSAPKLTTEEKLIIKPIITGLSKKFSTNPGTHEDKIASAKKIKNNTNERTITFCHSGSFTSSVLRRRNILKYYHKKNVVNEIPKW